MKIEVLVVGSVIVVVGKFRVWVIDVDDDYDDEICLFFVLVVFLSWDFVRVIVLCVYVWWLKSEFWEIVRCILGLRFRFVM